MKGATDEVQTSNYVRSLELMDYRFGQQYDCHEALVQILDTIFPNYEESMFRIEYEQTTSCDNCGLSSKRYQPEMLLCLKFVKQMKYRNWTIF